MNEIRNTNRYKLVKRYARLGQLSIMPWKKLSFAANSDILKNFII